MKTDVGANASFKCVYIWKRNLNYNLRWAHIDAYTALNEYFEEQFKLFTPKNQERETEQTSWRGRVDIQY